jgi:hypothetical protein
MIKLATLCILLAPLAVAQQASIRQENGNWVQDVSGTLAKVSNVHIKAETGSVRVTGTSQGNISYAIQNRAYTSSQEKAKRQFDSYKINAYVRGDTAWIVAEWEGDSPRRFGSDFIITVPDSTAWVKVESDAGDIQMAGIAGRADAESGGGGIQLKNVGGEIQVETGGGKVEVNNIGGDAHIETGGGDVVLGSIKGKVVASTGGGNMRLASSQQDAVIETGAGSIHVGDCGGMLRVSTGGGDIELGTLNNGAQVETGGGSIHLAEAKGFVKVESGSGHIQLDGVPAAYVETGAGGIVAKFIAANGGSHDSRLETSSGDVTVYIAPTIHITLDAAIEVANGHTVQSDFPEIRVFNEGGPWGSKRAEGDINGGGPVLKIRTTSGDILIHRGQ